ncbi:DUF4390 domain-containing protein [Sulfurivirga sp.]|uniref:DUF4390 domain-containing protein n=1 Tax=Sulfurivirga sp. TaxID=2614236 RepID=UPI0025EE6BC0|nr:DUF4390 domain-containing protein [Sulfurivirga sp.]
MRCWKSLLSGLLLTLALMPARAEHEHLAQVTVLFFQHHIEQRQLMVDARVRIKLSTTQRDALEHDIPLYFITRFRLVEHSPLMGFIPWQRTVIEREVPVRLQRARLQGRWLLTNLRNGRQSEAETLEEALDILGTFSDIHLVDQAELHPGIDYRLRLRLQLDRNRLPAALWLESLTDPTWRLDSGWVEESVDQRKLWQR